MGWLLTVRCNWGKREGMKSIRECTWSIEIDMPTLVATRGRDLPIASLGHLFRCLRCGSRRVRMLFDLPPNANAVRQEA